MLESIVSYSIDILCDNTMVASSTVVDGFVFKNIPTKEEKITYQFILNWHFRYRYRERKRKDTQRFSRYYISFKTVWF